MLTPDYEYRARSMAQYGMHDPLPHTGQGSSVAALTVTIIVDDNSNEGGHTELSIIPLSFHMTLA